MAAVLSLRCPHCETRARVRTSRQVTALVSDLNMACDNSECGHTFAAQIQIVRTISPSACPDPRVQLPVAPPRAPMKRRFAPANDNGPAEAAEA